MQNLVNGSFLFQSARKHTHRHTPSKATLIICRAQRNPLFLIYFVSVYQLSLVAHTHTHTHTRTNTHTLAMPGKTNTLLICPPRGLCGLSVKFPSIKTRVDLETEQRRRRLTSRCHLAKVRRQEKDSTALSHRAGLRTQSGRGSALRLRLLLIFPPLSNTDLILESDGEVWL